MTKLPNLQSDHTTVKMDKFGRILIPKKIRNELGVQAGSELEIFITNEDGRIQIEVKPKKKIVATTTHWGWTSYGVEGAATQNYSITDMVRDAREERADRIAGILGDDY